MTRYMVAWDKDVLLTPGGAEHLVRSLRKAFELANTEMAARRTCSVHWTDDEEIVAKVIAFAKEHGVVEIDPVCAAIAVALIHDPVWDQDEERWRKAEESMLRGRAQGAAAGGAHLFIARYDDGGAR